MNDRYSTRYYLPADYYYNIRDHRRLYSDVRYDLDRYFGFGPSRGGACLVDFGPLRSGGEPPMELARMMEAAGIPAHTITRVIEGFADGTLGSTCINARRKFGGRDYVVVLPDDGDRYNWPVAMGHEVNHGEHRTLHDGDGELAYSRRFSECAYEFIACMGSEHVARRLGIVSGSGPRCRREEYRPDAGISDGRLVIDLPRIVGGQLARLLPDDAPRWKLFDARNEHCLWAGYNDIQVPEIEIYVPREVDSGLDRIGRRIKQFLGERGLRCEVSVYNKELYYRPRW